MLEKGACPSQVLQQGQCSNTSCEMLFSLERAGGERGFFLETQMGTHTTPGRAWVRRCHVGLDLKDAIHLYQAVSCWFAQREHEVAESR